MRSLKLTFLAAVLATPLTVTAAPAQILGWNNLGMHCMDSDYSVFSILPPYNTIEAQLIVNGRLVLNGAGYTVTYQAVADPDGSFNSTAMGKGNFYTYCGPLYGPVLPAEMGLAGWAMPGTNNVPQTMLFEQTNRPAAGVATKVNWFRAEGIPIAPYDDSGPKNAYPLMRVTARNGGGTPIATNDIVLPVSDEMDCRACHASGTEPAAEPGDGWVWSTSPERDYRLNILRLHDALQFGLHGGLYQAALAARGFNPQGLYRGGVADGKPVLCAICHASEALGTGSYSNIPPLTASVHAGHARVLDPDLRIRLDNSAVRAACYRCHPGSTTKCLRGAMGASVASDGTTAIQCQSCHGSMSQVGSTNRVGWFMEPNCQSCHTGTAISNNGQIRYISCFETNGDVRIPVNRTFATMPDTPAGGLSLYRFSAGHGGLQCSACHGSTHAEFPATHHNDNRRNEQIQGHAGVTVECTTCHVAMPVSATSAAGGPHGLHPVGQAWANGHGDLLEGNPSLRSSCGNCHGADGSGSVLSRMQNTRVITTEENKFGTLTYWRGRQVSCFDCHNGPNSTDPSTHPQALALNVSTNTTSAAPVSLSLQASGAGTLTYHIVGQAAHGSVGVTHNIATYFPDPGFVGADQFTFAAWNGWTDSNLATGSVNVAQGPFSVSAVAHVPATWPAGWLAPLSAVATPSNTTATVTYDWDFGDGSPHSTDRYASHIYAAPNSYHWTLLVQASTAAATRTGTIVIDEPAALGVSASRGELTLTWPADSTQVVLEHAPTIGAAPNWTPATEAVEVAPGVYMLPVSSTVPAEFFRLRQVR